MEAPAAPPTMPAPAAEAHAAADSHAGYDAAFVPPTAMQPDRRQPRMPKIEDFPLIAQKEMRAKGAPAEHGEHHGGHDDHRRPGLLRRLASVGLGRRDDSDDSEAIEPPVPVAETAQEPISEYARKPQRPAQPEQPRHAPQVANAPRRGPAIDDDQYEIPAFLRRQAN
jgi:cell division protein FtsZ